MGERWREIGNHMSTMHLYKTGKDDCKMPTAKSISDLTDLYLQLILPAYQGSYLFTRYYPAEVAIFIHIKNNNG